jgi:hypothetical protein
VEKTVFEYLHGCYSSQNIIHMIKIRENEMGGACDRERGRRNICRILWGNLIGKVYLEDLGIDSGIILK